MTLEEFSALLAEGGDPFLVEFGVPHGCTRCAQMRGPIDRLALGEDERLKVRRVNLRENPSVAWEFDITVCPSYVAFRDGKEVFRAAYPTSADLIQLGLQDALRDSTADQVSLATP